MLLIGWASQSVPTSEKIKLSFKAQVIIPAGHAVILGSFAGLAIGSVAVAIGGEPLTWGLASGSVVMTGAYLKLVSTYYVEEQEVRVYEDTVQVNLLDDTSPYLKGQYMRLQVRRDKLVRLAIGLQAGKSFSLASFGGRGKIFSRTEFELLRDEFIVRGLAQWVNPEAHTMGVALTRGGWAFVRHFSSLPDTTSPPSIRLGPGAAELPRRAYAHTRT
jgi:hypothetical protein